MRKIGKITKNKSILILKKRTHLKLFGYFQVLFLIITNLINKFMIDKNLMGPSSIEAKKKELL